MIYDTLYRRDENGNIRIWMMESNDVDAYRTISGVKGGKLVTSEWKTVEGKGIGKAFRNPAEQAESEIKSKYKKQLETQYHKTEADVDKQIKFDPMLAQKYERFVPGTFAQPKLDGIRAIVTKNEIRSRTGKAFVAVPHILESLSKFFERHPDAILDGELYNHDFKDDFNKITSLVKKTKPTQEDLDECVKLIQFWAYDVPSEGDEKFSVRYAWLAENLTVSNSIVLVETHEVKDEEHLDTLNDEFISAEYEGQMVRLDEPYENKRSKYLLKRKEFIDAEFKLISIDEGQGNWSGAAKSVTCTLPNGTTFSAGIKGNRERGRELLGQNYDLVTVRFFRLTPDGIPRFGICTAFYEADNIEDRKPHTEEEIQELLAKYKT